MESSQLSALISEFRSASDRVANMEREYSEKDWQRKPAPERWSAIECVWHLNWTSEKMIENVRRALNGIKSESKPNRKYRLDLFGWFLVKSLSPKNRIAKFKTTAPSASESSLNVPEVLAKFRELQTEMIDLIRESDGLKLGNGRVESPFHSKVHYNIYSAFRVTAVHQHRHLDQAERTVHTSMTKSN